MIIHFECISGFVFGAEYVDGEELNGTPSHFVSIDLCFFRVLVEVEK